VQIISLADGNFLSSRALVTAGFWRNAIRPTASTQTALTQTPGSAVGKILASLPLSAEERVSCHVEAHWFVDMPLPDGHGA
jgi:hypothetical protein